MSAAYDGIRVALNYIEDHLTGDLQISEIAAQAGLSPFHFQRTFSAVCGMGPGEYIRSRRLTLAARELCCTDAKIIDIAAKYGYDAPESFTRAFLRFHGVTPSAARTGKTPLRVYGPLRIHTTWEVYNMLEYRIEEKPQFTVMGYCRRFTPDTSYQEIPKFWDAVFCSGNAPLIGMYGLCLDSDSDGNSFEYMIADNYIAGAEVPAGCITKVIPAHTWAVFPCRGPLPQALQEVNTRMWSEWLPGNKDYRLAASLNIEMYAPIAENPQDTYSEIWLPVEKV